MAGRGRPGPAPDLEKRDLFAKLISEGIGHAAARRAVGINMRTGRRWRHGRTIRLPSGNVVHYAAVINSRDRPISPRYLSEAERLAIADLHRQGHSGRAIAAALGRSR